MEEVVERIEGHGGFVMRPPVPFPCGNAQSGTLKGLEGWAGCLEVQLQRQRGCERRLIVGVEVLDVLRGGLK